MNGASVILVVLSALTTLGVIAAVALLLKRRTDAGGADLDAQLQSLTERLEGRFSEAARQQSETAVQHSERVGRLERDISERIAALHESQKQSLAIADELRGLQRILKTPAQRGALGEFFLETALRNVLAPGLYEMQYTFPGGTLRADAVVKYQDRLIPIDAKFSLDNYNRYVEAATDGERETFGKATREDLKKRIDETSKYVRPEDDTFDFALMFVPSEALYYDLIVNQVGALGRDRSLIEYAHEKRVVPVSPMVLYAYLQTVLHGIQQMRFAQDAEEIRKRVGELAAHLRAYEEHQRKLGQSISNAASTFSKAAAEYNKIDKDVVRISGQSAKGLGSGADDAEAVG